MTMITEERQLALKTEAAAEAVSLLTSDMIVGLGTGSTAILAVRMIADRLAKGELQNVIGIPTSVTIEAEAARLNIPLATLEEHPVIEVTIDGADEVSPELDVIKGGGGALLREKIVAQASKRLIIIVDETKMSDRLGTTWAVPVEVVSFGWTSQKRFLEELGAAVKRRPERSEDPQSPPYLTDHGNFILDCNFGPIANPEELAAQMNRRAGIVEHGLFLHMATDVIIAGQNGIERIKRT